MQNRKIFWGGGCPLPDPSPSRERDTPPHTLPLSTPTAPRFSRLRRSTSAPPAPRPNCQYLFSLILGPECHTVYGTQNMHMEWKTVTGNPQVTRKLKDFAKMCYACNTSPKLALWTSVTISHVCYLCLKRL